MKDVLKATYEVYEKRLQELFNEVAETKKMLNKLAKDLGNPVPWEDVVSESVAGGGKIRPDQFFNKPLATAVREFLESRKVAVEWGEIVKGLRLGGFELQKTKQAENEARLTILRNTANFVLIGDNYFGLKSWYPERREKEKNQAEEAERPTRGKSSKEDQTPSKSDDVETRK